MDDPISETYREIDINNELQAITHLRTNTIPT